MQWKSSHCFDLRHEFLIRKVKNHSAKTTKTDEQNRSYKNVIIMYYILKT